PTMPNFRNSWCRWRNSRYRRGMRADTSAGNTPASLRKRRGRSATCCRGGPTGPPAVDRRRRTRLCAVDHRTKAPDVGRLGGGQLARLTRQAAIPLGHSLQVLAVSDSASAALVAANVEVGPHTALEALKRFAAGCDVATFDHEHVPGEHLRELAA